MTEGRLLSTLTTPSQHVVLWPQQGTQVNSQQVLTTAHNMLWTWAPCCGCGGGSQQVVTVVVTDLLWICCDCRPETTFSGNTGAGGACLIWAYVRGSLCSLLLLKFYPMLPAPFNFMPFAPYWRFFLLLSHFSSCSWIWPFAPCSFLEFPSIPCSFL